MGLFLALNMTDLLDSTIKKVTVHDGFSNLPDRIRHIFVDGLILTQLSTLIQTTVGIRDIFPSYLSRAKTELLLLFSVYLLYYLLMEYFFGFTLGKWLNKTRVVSISQHKPTFRQILIRTISRLIPIGFVTLFTPYKAFLHDILSETRVMRIRKKNQVHVNDI